MSFRDIHEKWLGKIDFKKIMLSSTAQLLYYTVPLFVHFHSVLGNALHQNGKHEAEVTAPPLMYTRQTLIINSFSLIRYTSLESAIYHFRRTRSANWSYYVKWNLFATPITRCLFGREEGLCLPKREAYHEVLAYFSVTLRKVLDGYEEMSILKASGINILFCQNNRAAGSVSILQALYICCPPADRCSY